MSDLDYDALRSVAENEQDVRPGPYTERREGQWEWSVRDADGTDLGWTAVQYRSAFDPPTVLRLLDLAQRAEADRAAIERVRALADDLDERAGSMGEKAQAAGMNFIYQNHADRLRRALDPEAGQ